MLSLTRTKALLVNSVIVILFIAIAILLPDTWMTFRGFLALAVVIRCVIALCIFAQYSEFETGISRNAKLLLIWNLICGLLIAEVFVDFVWWIGRFWPDGIKLFVAFTEVFVAYKSTLSLPAKKSG